MGNKDSRPKHRKKRRSRSSNSHPTPETTTTQSTNEEVTAHVKKKAKTPSKKRRKSPKHRPGVPRDNPKRNMEIDNQEMLTAQEPDRPAAKAPPKVEPVKESLPTPPLKSVKVEKKESDALIKVKVCQAPKTPKKESGRETAADQKPTQTAKEIKKKIEPTLPLQSAKIEKKESGHEIKAIQTPKKESGREAKVLQTPKKESGRDVQVKQKPTTEQEVKKKSDPIVAAAVEQKPTVQGCQTPKKESGKETAANQKPTTEQELKKKDSGKDVEQKPTVKKRELDMTAVTEQKVTIEAKKKEPETVAAAATEPKPPVTEQKPMTAKENDSGREVPESTTSSYQSKKIPAMDLSI